MNAKYEFVEGDEKEIAPGVVLRTHREYSLLIEVATSRIEAARAELGEKS